MERHHRRQAVALLSPTRGQPCLLYSSHYPYNRLIYKTKPCQYVEKYFETCEHINILFFASSVASSSHDRMSHHLNLYFTPGTVS